MPAFVDAHVHLVMAGLSLDQVDLGAVDGRRAFERTIADAAARLDREDPSRTRWIEAWGWSAERWAAEGGADPDRTWFAAAGPRPAIAWRMDRHACVLNDAAIAAVERRHPGLPVLPGGEVRRDAAGRPTGLLVEANAWQQAQSEVPAPDAARRRAALRSAAQHLHRFGVATVGSMEYAREVREAILPEAATLPLRVRLTLLDRDWPIDPSLAARINAEIAAQGSRASAWTKVIGFKAFADGTLGLRTARMLEPYLDAEPSRGMLVELALEGRLGAWARLVHESGLSPAIHAIGDEALRRALDAYEPLAADAPVTAPPRIEHAQTLHRGDLPRVRGRMLSMQPLHRVEDALVAPRALGEARLAGFFAFRSLQEAGAILAFGSDWPIVAPDAIEAVRSAVTARIADGRVFHADETISPQAALLAHTRDAARCLGLDSTGVLREGLDADLVVLDRDPLAADWLDSPPKVLATIVGGEVVFDPQGVLA